MKKGGIGMTETKKFTLALPARPTAEGFDILAISAGEARGHGITFSAPVLRESLRLWDGLPVGIDHPGLFETPSLRNLAGILTRPEWSEEEQGIRLKLKPAGPAAETLIAIRDAALSEPALAGIIGFSAVLRLQYRESGEVTKIISVRGVDAVIDPARGGKFLQAAADNQDARKGADQMQEEIQAASEAAQTERGEGVLKAMCAHMLTASLNASKLPPASQAALRKQFEGRAFQPGELESAIGDKRAELAQVTGSQIVQGPGRTSGTRGATSLMFNSEDQLQCALEDLLEAP